MSSLGAVPITTDYWYTNYVGGTETSYDGNSCFNGYAYYGDKVIYVKGDWAEGARPTSITISGTFCESVVIIVEDENLDVVGSLSVYGKTSPFVIPIAQSDYPIYSLYFSGLYSCAEPEDYALCSIVFGEDYVVQADCCWTNKVRVEEPECSAVVTPQEPEPLSISFEVSGGGVEVEDQQFYSNGDSNGYGMYGMTVLTHGPIPKGVRTIEFDIVLPITAVLEYSEYTVSMYPFDLRYNLTSGEWDFVGSPEIEQKELLPQTIHFSTEIPIYYDNQDLYISCYMGGPGTTWPYASAPFYMENFVIR